MTNKEIRNMFLTLAAIFLIGFSYYHLNFNRSFIDNVDFKEINNHMKIEREINELQKELFVK